MTDPTAYWTNNSGPPFLGPTGLHAWAQAILDKAADDVADDIGTDGSNVRVAGDAVWLSAAALATAMDGVVKSATGKDLRVVAGVIRNAGSPDYWQPISDTPHAPVNVDSVLTTNEQITIDYSTLGATKVVSFIIVPDEALAKIGIVAGASVGLTSTIVQLTQTRPYADYVSYNGSAWVSANGVFTLSYNSTTGSLTCTHPLIPTASGTDIYDVSIAGRGDLIASSNGASETAALVRWHSYSGTLQTTAATTQKAFVSHGASGPLDPQRLDTTSHPGSNLWFIGLFEA